MDINNSKDVNNDLLIQWGRTALSGNISGGNNKSTTTTFPIAFDVGVNSIIAIHSTGNQMLASIFSVSQTQATIVFRNVNSSTSANLVGTYWIAIGC